jgi:FtsP/CotA-like multicopper oxidase with cupredoxin domain
MRDLIRHVNGLLLRGAATGVCALLACAAEAAVPGITAQADSNGVVAFDLSAAAGYTSQPDGASIYTWGYGCNTAPTGPFVPGSIAHPANACPNMQLPGPTLVVTEGQTVKITLHNQLPVAAGNTSMLFPGFTVTTSGGLPGVLTQEAKPSTDNNQNSVTYTFVADKPGTHSYYSGTQGDVQIEMGLYGALIVLPSSPPAACNNTENDAARTAHDGNGDFRLAHAAYDHPSTCYDREYLFQLSEMDPAIHRQAEEQANLPCNESVGCMVIQTEPYKSAYFLVNGRSMPDDMDPNYASQYPNQPYNGNPHMHPGELTLLRIIGQGRMQHPFHEHANHVRVLARDGNLELNAAGSLDGPLLFTTTTTPGQTIDALFQWTGKGLNWDVYAHADGITSDDCTPDQNGFYTAVPAADNYYEWCADHKKPLESKPFGAVGKDGPVTLPDPNITALGAWYSGSPYLGPEATARAVGGTPIPPFGTVGNSPSEEAGFAYMWHSHNEREITTNNIFPGGMMMMMLVDPWVFGIDEAK